MRSVEDQLAIIIDAAVTPEPVRISIADALGLMSAEEVVATEPLPGFPQAAIDGYAVRAVDVGGERALRVPNSTPKDDEDAEDSTQVRDSAHPRDSANAHLSTNSPAEAISMPVVGEVPAGSHQPLRLQPKQAVRVYTGAPLPTLADAVLPLDWSDRGRKRMRALRPVSTGDFVRRVGDDIQPGDVAVSAGSILGPAQIGLLAAAGRSKVLAYPRPRVSVLAYGHELVEIERTPSLGQVFDVASHALAAAAREAGGQVNRAGIMVGEPRKLRETILTEMHRSELLVLTGAVGGADSEPILQVLRDIGDVDTTRVAMHPGSVQGFGLLGDARIPILLLPNNPVAALVAFEVLGRPLIRASLGKSAIQRRVVRARSINHVDSIAGRRGFVRARLMRDAETNDYLVEGLGGATGAPAHLLAGLAEANSMIRVPEDVIEVRPGDIVDVLFLAQRS